MTAISIIVPCRNEVPHIRTFLECLLTQDMAGFDWEAIIADGRSDDGSRDVLDEYSRRCPNIRWIDNPRKIVSTGLNEAIRQARGEFILRMDMHTEYAPDYVRRCIETIVATGADNVGGPARTRAEGALAQAIAAAYHSPFSCGGARFHDEECEGCVDTVPYGCWRRETLLRLGLFDESLVRNQDDELNLRIVRSGGKIWQSPRILSWYSPRSSLPGLFRQYFQYGFWKVAVIRKHRLPASWRHLVPGAFVLAVSSLPILVLAGWAFGAQRSAALLGALWVLTVGTYLVACVIASVMTARRRGWRLLGLLPVVFICYHLAYGFGFLCGLFFWKIRPLASRSPSKLFTQITRS